MVRTTAFWDASALVPICMQQTASAQARANLRKYTPIVWWGTAVEIHSAISRAHRHGALNDAAKQGALTRLNLLAQGWKEITPSDALRSLAEDLLDQHSLRAADSLQLAAALRWCHQRPARKTFLCGDKKLNDAAALVGFTVVQFP